MPRGKQSRETAKDALVRNQKSLTRVCANSQTALAPRLRQETASASSTLPLSQQQEPPIQSTRTIRRAGKSCTTCRDYSAATGEYPECDGDHTLNSCGLRSPYQKDAFPSQAPNTSSSQTQPAGTMQALQYAGDSRPPNPSVGSGPPESLFQSHQGGPADTQQDSAIEELTKQTSGENWKESWTAFGR
jgi:hypothetical protein